MRVLFAIKSLNVKGGGAEKVLVQLANGLSRRGHTVGILTFDPPGESFYALGDGIDRFDIGIVPVGQPTSLGPLIHAAPRIRRVVRNFNADFFVPFMHSIFIPLSLLTWGLKQRTIFSDHVDYTHYQLHPRQFKLLKLVYRFAEAITVPSIAAWKTYREEDQARMVVMPNPVTGLGEADAQSPTEDDKPVLLCVGAFRKEKDHAVLIDAFAGIADAFPEWTLRIVGEGNLRPTLEEQIAAKGFGDRIQLPGSTRNIVAEYQKAAFVVLPSQYESFGLVAAEALGAGRAVLSFSECVGVSALVEDGKNGILVEGGATHETRLAALQQGLRKLMGDAEVRQRLGAAGPASIQPYGIEPILDKWETLMSEV